MKRPIVYAVMIVVLTGCAHPAARSVSHQNRTSHSLVGETHWNRENQVKFTYRVDGSDSVLQFNSIALRFPNLRAAEREVFFFQKGAVWVQVAGDGFAQVSVMCQNGKAKTTFFSQYENGTNKVQFCGREFKLAKQGRQVVTGDHVVDVSDGEQELAIRR